MNADGEHRLQSGEISCELLDVASENGGFCNAPIEYKKIQHSLNMNFSWCLLVSCYLKKFFVEVGCHVPIDPDL